MNGPPPVSGVNSPTTTTPTPDDDPLYFSSEFILFIGLFIILCFLLCLIALNGCTFIRHFSHNVSTSTNRLEYDSAPVHFSLPATKLLRTIPKLTYSSTGDHNSSSDCAICLSEFVAGDEIRVLPSCQHCFHVACIDRWIGSHFTCPSCRQMLLKPTRCDRCVETT